MPHPQSEVSMSLINSAFNLAGEIARLVPGYGTAIAAGIDLAREVWNIARPIVSDTASAFASQATQDWPPQQQAWVSHAIDGVFG